MKTSFKTRWMEDKVELGSVELEYDEVLPATLAEAETRFGAETAFRQWRSGATVDIQKVIRPMLKDGKSKDEIITACKNWDGETSTADPVAAAKRAVAKMSPEQKAELLALLA